MGTYVAPGENEELEEFHMIGEKTFNLRSLWMNVMTVDCEKEYLRDAKM